MKKEYVVYTSLFGDYDKLSEIKDTDELCDYICFTDQENLSVPGWDIRIIKHASDPVLMNRMYKMLPHQHLNNYNKSLYVDSNIVVSGKLSTLIDMYVNKQDISIPKHFMRNCSYSEASFCYENDKINGTTYDYIIKKVYRFHGFPENFGLGENNIIIRTHKSKALNQAMEQWWDMFINIARRDQLLLMFILWQHQIKFGFMQESARNKNLYFDYRLHNSLIKKNLIKKILLSMSARRDRNILFKAIGKLLDRL